MRSLAWTCSARRHFRHRRSRRCIDQAASWAVAFFERRNLLRDLVLGHGEILRVQPLNIASLAVGNGDVQLHQVDVHKDAPIVILCLRVYACAGGKAEEYYED